MTHPQNQGPAARHSVPAPDAMTMPMSVRSALPPRPPAPAAPDPAPMPAVVRRPGRRFLPPSGEREQPVVVVSRDFARSGRKTVEKGKQIGRNRKMAGNLPAWDPLPSGENLINRPGHAR